MAIRASIALRAMGNPSQLVRLATRAEAAGFRRIWLVEVYETDVLVLAAALAQHTKRIGIASGVVNASLRSPFLLAMATATVSDLSRGRFALGVGAGSPPMGSPLSPHPDRPVARLRETLEVVVPLLRGELVNHDGELFKARGLRLGVPPSRHVEVFAAAMGPKTVEIAARYADGVLLMLPTVGFVKDAKAAVLETLERREGAPSQFRVACHLVTCVSRERAEAEAAARSAVAYFVTVGIYRESFKRLGFRSEVEELNATIETKGQKVAAEKVPKEMLDELVVYGTPSDCRAKIARYVEAGVDEPVIYQRSTRSTSLSDVDRTISLIQPARHG
jgi:alkanesulfonate monooxygenase SsuD/methylene tetrahydromethanopterin reductase-like flavin-dependent oxidoreductase (luciferase family)